LLIAIALGLLGKGPLSEAGVGSSEDAIQMKYERFMRHRSPDNLRLTVQPSSDTVRVMLDSQYARRIEIEKITPEPEHVISGPDATTFVFNAGSSGQMHAQFYIRPEKVGKLEGWIAVEGKPRHTFSQFVYP
jgi:hypothetical protein